jgi:TonB family protein
MNVAPDTSQLENETAEEADHKIKEVQPTPSPPTEIKTAPEKEPPRAVVNDTSVQASTTVPTPAVIASRPEHVMNVAPDTSQLENATDEEADHKVKEVQPTPSPPTEIKTALEKDSPHIVVNDSSSSASPTVPEPAVIASPPERLTNVSPDTSKLKDQPDVAQAMAPLVPPDDVARSQPPKSTVRTPHTSSSRKRCPKCNAVYDSELLAYCAIDMTPLVDADKPVVTSPPETSRISLVWFLVVITFLVAGGFAYLMIPSFKNEPGSPTTTLPIQAVNVQELPLVGGGLSGKQLEVPAPEYPASARSEHVSGTVTIRVTVDQKGRVIAVKVVEGDSRLRKAAIAAAQRATFSPEKLMNQGAVGTIAYTFKE